MFKHFCQFINQFSGDIEGEATEKRLATLMATIR